MLGVSRKGCLARREARVLDSDATGDGVRVGNPEMSSEYSRPSVSSSDDPRKYLSTSLSTATTRLTAETLLPSPHILFHLTSTP
jgi:hypothetical protein